MQKIENNRLSRMLRAFHLTAAEFAEYTGIDRKTVGRWAKGEQQVPEQLRKQVYLYGVKCIITSEGIANVYVKRFGDVVWSRKGKPVKYKHLTIKESNTLVRKIQVKVEKEIPHLDGIDLQSKIGEACGLGYRLVKQFNVDEDEITQDK